jgi:hypothetical protein
MIEDAKQSYSDMNTLSAMRVCGWQSQYEIRSILRYGNTITN